jgi:transposase
LKIFPGQNFEALGAAEEVTRSSTHPIRLKRCDMVRLKRALKMGRTGTSSDVCESKVIRERSGHFHLVMPIKMSERESDPIWKSQSYQDVFLDPGGRTFMTAYSPDGVAAALGDDFYSKLLPTLRRADLIMSNAEARRRHMNARDRTYRRMLIRAHALRTKVRNCVRDLHRKTARFLCSNFKAIFIPKFEVGRISDTTSLGRRISSSAVRGLMTFAHGEFLQTITGYAKARSVHVIQVGEAYTTKTCTFCGRHNDVGSRKVFRCCGCGKRVHRDPAASRNIGFRTAVRVD